VAYPNATDDPAEFGPVDYVFLGLKAHSYPSCGPLVEPLLGEHTAVLPAQNGIPWWYFHELPGPYQGRRIEAGSRWCHECGAVTGAGYRLRGLSGDDDRGARSDPPRRAPLSIGEPSGRSRNAVKVSDAMIAGG
jgi:2-dehydropantoate 2-reductase